VHDVAGAYVEALEHARAGTRYTLCGENVSQWRVFDIVRDLTGLTPPRRVPYVIAKAIGAVEEVRASLTGAMPLVTRGAVEVFRHDWAFDSADAIRDLGYTITPLACGIRETVKSLSPPDRIGSR